MRICLHCIDTNEIYTVELQDENALEIEGVYLVMFVERSFMTVQEFVNTRKELINVSFIG